jgi:hypothetical protein
MRKKSCWGGRRLASCIESGIRKTTYTTCLGYLHISATIKAEFGAELMEMTSGGVDGFNDDNVQELRPGAQVSAQQFRLRSGSEKTANYD